MNALRLEAVAALLTLAAAATPVAAGEAAAVVEMTNTPAFAPQEVTIVAGESIEWRNTSLLVHTVTDDPDRAAAPGDAVLPEGAEPFGSGNLEPGERYRHTFTVPGSYRYFCIPHEAAGMRGRIVVREAR